MGLLRTAATIGIAKKAFTFLKGQYDQRQGQTEKAGRSRTGSRGATARRGRQTARARRR